MRTLIALLIALTLSASLISNVGIVSFFLTLTFCAVLIALFVKIARWIVGLFKNVSPRAFLMITASILFPPCAPFMIIIALFSFRSTNHA
jgi:hypothetical protein